ncbi:MAG: hypothetical protein R3C03_06815 [Pirellulaceae bacterium]
MIASPQSADQEQEIETARMTGAPEALDYEQHIAGLRNKYDLSGFHVVVEAPFVVVGDEDSATVELRAEKTIRWAVQHLKKTYFTRDPDHVITIWLFRDKESYEQHCQEFFETKPTTPFGFYTSVHRSLIMNIRTGGGTLVHEIVHPFIAANFPECPSWFNEGLASLYEQCGEVDGQIHGFTNWRLRGLQQAIAHDSVPEFEVLMKTGKREFYDDDPGTNYSQARYLCYYLQQKGLLKEFYEEFRQNVKDDPAGIASLQSVLNRETMEGFKGEWETFVETLEFN